MHFCFLNHNLMKKDESFDTSSIKLVEKKIKFKKQIDLSFNEKTNQSANPNFCFSAIDYILSNEVNMLNRKFLLSNKMQSSSLPTRFVLFIEILKHSSGSCIFTIQAINNTKSLKIKGGSINVLLQSNNYSPNWINNTC